MYVWIFIFLILSKIYLLTVCEDCNDLYHGDCPVHGPLGTLDLTSGVDQDSMRYTDVPIPAELTVHPSIIPEAGLGVFAKKLIARNIKVGPYKGKKLTVFEMEDVQDTSYIWEVGEWLRIGELHPVYYHIFSQFILFCSDTEGW